MEPVWQTTESRAPEGQSRADQILQPGSRLRLRPKKTYSIHGPFVGELVLLLRRSANSVSLISKGTGKERPFFISLVSMKLPDSL